MTRCDTESISPPSPDPLGWQRRAIAKRQERDEAIRKWGLSIPSDIGSTTTQVKYIPRDCGILSESEVQITEACPSVILKKIARKTWSSEQVLRAFISRTIIAHHLTNPLTEIFFQRGLERARELDRIQNADPGGRLVGPLHGLPISLKDTLNLKGEQSTTGFVHCIGTVQTEDDTLVDILHQAGAVFYCKTNVPQGLMSGECVNNIFGRTSTPWNTRLSAGGSSGGEGSLISLGGSPLGIGGDIAGSIRTPANFNGIYGLCPSSGRLPTHRASNLDGDSLIIPVYGPMARAVDGLELFARTILDESMEPWERDHSTLRMPWREDQYLEGLGTKHQLCFGFMPHDGVVRPNPPIERCMAELRRRLEDAGHQCIDLEPFDGWELMDIAIKVFSATGGKDTWAALKQSGEPMIKELQVSPPEAAVSAWEYRQAAIQLGVIRERYLGRIVEGTRHKTRSGRRVDGIILPSGGTVAPPHGTMEYFTYEAISNILNWTCATIPVGFVDPVLDGRPQSFDPMSHHDVRNFEKYTPEYYSNAPVCLQLMGLQHEEEKVLGMLRTIDRAMGRDEYHSA